MGKDLKDDKLMRALELAQKEPAFNNLVTALTQLKDYPPDQRQEMFWLALLVVGIDELMFKNERSKHR